MPQQAPNKHRAHRPSTQQRKKRRTRVIVNARFANSGELWVIVSLFLSVVCGRVMWRGKVGLGWMDWVRGGWINLVSLDRVGFGLGDEFDLWC